jgi:glycosyltransferase involved in cell wall biosynthesis
MTPDRRPHALVIAHTFPPHAAIGSQRTMRVIKQLHARGWQVTVLTGDPATYLPHTPVDTALLEQIPPGVRIVRAGTWHGWTHLGNALVKSFEAGGVASGSPSAADALHARGRSERASRRLAARSRRCGRLALDSGRRSGWLVPAVIKGARELRHQRPDVIYSSAPPWTGPIVAYMLRLLLRAPWVADFRDPWARAPWRGDRMRVALRAAAFLERVVVGKADHILFAARGNRDEFAKHYGPAAAARFHFITNGCDPEEFRQLAAAGASVRRAIRPAPCGLVVCRTDADVGAAGCLDGGTPRADRSGASHHPVSRFCGPPRRGSGRPLPRAQPRRQRGVRAVGAACRQPGRYDVRIGRC